MHANQTPWTIRINGKSTISSHYVRDYVDNVFAHVRADMEGILAKPASHESKLNAREFSFGKKTNVQPMIREERYKLSSMLQQMDKVKQLMTKELERAFFGDPVTDTNTSVKAESYLAQGAQLWNKGLSRAETEVRLALQSKPEWMQQAYMEIFNQRIKAPLYRRALIEFQAKGLVGDSMPEQNARAEIHTAFEQAKHANRISKGTEEKECQY